MYYLHTPWERQGTRFGGGIPLLRQFPPEISQIKAYLIRTWKHLTTRVEVDLKDVFPKPENKGLLHIWKWGSADLLVYRHGKLVCLIESGGSHHWEKKQSLNDCRKWKLAEINGVRCLTMMNGMMKRLSIRKWRELLGRYIFGLQETE